MTLILFLLFQMANTPTSAAHTPGPWYIDRHSPYAPICIKPYPGRIICDIDGADAEAEANARLIVAAPEQHRTLEAIRNDCQAWLNGDTDMAASDLFTAIESAAAAVVAKAKGKAA